MSGVIAGSCKEVCLVMTRSCQVEEHDRVSDDHHLQKGLRHSHHPPIQRLMLTGDTIQPELNSRGRK